MSAVRRVIEFVSALCLSSAVACWFQYGAIEMSWAGQRPLAPDASSGNVIPVNDHGILYVSQSDLNFQHYFVAPGLIFGGIGLILALVHHIIREPETRRQRSPVLRAAGTVAEIANSSHFCPFGSSQTPSSRLQKRSTTLSDCCL